LIWQVGAGDTISTTRKASFSISFLLVGRREGLRVCSRMKRRFARELEEGGVGEEDFLEFDDEGMGLGEDDFGRTKMMEVSHAVASSSCSSSSSSAPFHASKELVQVKGVKRKAPSKKGVSHKARRVERIGDETIIKGAWSASEDEVLKEAVAELGTEWKEVSKRVYGRSAKQCRDRFKLKLDPSINHSPFSPEEEKQLLDLHQKLGRQWTKIAKLMPGRTENSVKSKFASLDRSRRREWTPEEDHILRKCRAENVSFEDIASNFLTKRSEHSVKKRWERLFMRDLAKKIRQELPGQTRDTSTAHNERQGDGDGHVQSYVYDDNSTGEGVFASPSPQQQQQQQQQQTQIYPMSPGFNGLSIIKEEANDSKEIAEAEILDSLLVYGNKPSSSRIKVEFENSAERMLPAVLPPPVVKEEIAKSQSMENRFTTGQRSSKRIGNLRRQTTSVTILQQILPDPLPK